MHAGSFKQSMGAIGIELEQGCRTGRQASLVEMATWNRFLGLLKSLKIRALDSDDKN